MPSWTNVAKARNDFADLLDDLTTEQLQTPSLCEEWSVLDVGGHLASLIELSSFQMVKGIAKKRGNVDVYLADTAKGFANSGAGSIAQILRANAGKQLKPYSEASMVVDTAVHTLDVTRPLGIEGILDPTVLAIALDTSAGELAKRLGDGMPRLEATDSDWTQGDGPLVRGTSEALLLAMNGRDVSAELEGDGVELLSS